ncbi:ATP-grasp domain-containing protein [uncultured Gimesia sp.]|uniref:ATP-grasp domain-containing protein n=1 Tax=uncultured Gimesia sp. TaxID=1678688 RepID=UPI0030DCD489|tara:strand:+ start:125416 stop:126765 length:1350 start_codon:yes stop_codon:yes gene_type:complete
MNLQTSCEFSGKQRLLIVGASTRAAAFSALRAGWQPVCVDQYADQDLREIAEVIPKTANSTHWIETVHQSPALDWIYTGGMENHPELIEQINQKHRLRGCDPESLRRARDPFLLERLLKDEPIQALPCLPAGSVPDENTQWLCKPRQGAGGMGIRFLDSIAPDVELNQDCYLQRYQPGIPVSALYIAFRQTTVLIGVCQQFIGNAALNADAFQFCGGITVSPAFSHLRGPLEALGQSVADGCQIRGLFGCDLILDPTQQNRLWLNEVNPRYTALTELLELQHQTPLLDWHLTACRSFEEHSVNQTPARALKYFLSKGKKQPIPHISKGILYASRDLVSPQTNGNGADFQNAYQIPECGDIPCAGAVIPAGSPVCTIFGTGFDTVESYESSLNSLADRIIRYERHFEPEVGQTKTASNVFGMLQSIKKSENQIFPGFFSSWNEMGSFLED